MTQQQLYDAFNECGKIKTDFKFLELGTFDGVLFSSLDNIREKYTVDLILPASLKNYPKAFEKSTDDFFSEEHIDTFDLVFIDANHDIDFVVRDYNSSVERLTDDGLIAFHDCYPPEIGYCEPRYCSDSYKILEAFARLGHRVTFTKSNFGVTLIHSAKKIDPTQINYDLSYEEFVDVMETRYKHTEVEYQTLLNMITKKS